MKGGFTMCDVCLMYNMAKKMLIQILDREVAKRCKNRKKE